MKNPYEQIYSAFNFKIDSCTCSQDAEQLVRQMGLVYNVLGMVMKDVTKLLSCKYPKMGSQRGIGGDMGMGGENNLGFLFSLQCAANSSREEGNNKNSIICEQQEIEEHQTMQNHIINNKQNQQISISNIPQLPQYQNTYIYEYNYQKNEQEGQNKSSIQEQNDVEVYHKRKYKHDVIEIDD